MDINSYSFAPHMLDDSKTINRFRNDDIAIDLDKSGPGYSVFAFHYSGDFDLCEDFKTLDAAMKLFSSLIEHCSDGGHHSQAKVYRYVMAAKTADKI